MLLNEVYLSEEAKKITGTNCANCKFAAAERIPVSKNEVCEQGGLWIKDKKDLEKAKKGDLVTLPGKATVTEKFYCFHSKIDQYVTARMCCLYWDAEGVSRQFGEKAIS